MQKKIQQTKHQIMQQTQTPTTHERNQQIKHQQGMPKINKQNANKACSKH